jgi:rubrerythrin
MALTTFGAIMAFAMDMVTQTGEQYKALARRSTEAALKELLEDLAREEAKSRSKIEETRRLNVTEIMLEPVTGLLEEGYRIETKMSDPPADADVLGQALALEEREKRFFQDASAKVPLPEVARFFRKIVEKKERNLSRLASMGADGGGEGISS